MGPGLIWRTEFYHSIWDSISYSTHSMAHQSVKTIRKKQAELEAYLQLKGTFIVCLNMVYG